MPTVEYEDADGRRGTVECAAGETLRDALLAADLPVHNGPRLVSCHGHGTCGTCAVAVEGSVDPPEPEGRERARLSVPPHAPDSGLRLACQVTVEDDCQVRKGTGFWGQDLPETGTGQD
ncbi:MAG: 2Fe-2S iron-sulfur cluster binding domain-containing protein [Haloarculaceae archaeon]